MCVLGFFFLSSESSWRHWTPSMCPTTLSSSALNCCQSPMSFSPIEFSQNGLERKTNCPHPVLFPLYHSCYFVSQGVFACVWFIMDASQQIVNSSPSNCLHLSKVCVQSRQWSNTGCLCVYSRWCVCVLQHFSPWETHSSNTYTLWGPSALMGPKGWTP